jgi:hypothetical protein
MNADISPLKVFIRREHLTNAAEVGWEEGVAFAVQSMKGRAMHFHVLMKSGAHFRHVPLHWLWHTVPATMEIKILEQLQLWDCFSYKPVVTVFDLLRDYQVEAILRDKSKIDGTYYCTVDWLPDSDSKSGWLLHPDQNKCAHLLLLDNGQIGCLPTNRVLFKDGYYIGNVPDAATRNYKTVGVAYQAETCDRWSVADKEETFY